ncbi:MAG: Uncharacterized protein G01um101418_147 [Parcubacteria group bacterium Gr01-1014_18]|nr:MAG: Uncharacterized protein Greene041636_452 [Parcubacteria group bacterium Greene0416_36]TSC81474.1 MAG: Uncharacterized protein G01um101418_147 [Parcubacteria group bacterium Gr01-1014_18]TSC99072.1 MAG: Uncharacterized protein Greene101420_428 [Parcubacteria group bacterium Greene1014_20]TSD07247.1 MAG: Uncharacterized protein Greene07142_263 [Parcubacteria group bacterium Greene0714_2]
MQESMQAFIAKFRNFLNRPKVREYAPFFILACFLFPLYSYLYWTTGNLFNSPDETAASFFSRLYIETGTFSYTEPFNSLLPGWIHPRSMVIENGTVLPISFLGILLFLGTLGGIVGPWSIPYIIPLLSAIIPLFFYGFAKHIFSSKTAFWSAILLAIHPAIIYYNERNFLPNALFLDIFILFLFFFFAWISWKQKQKWIFAVSSSSLLALLISIRLFEAIWLGPLVLILCILFWKKNSMKEWLMWGILCSLFMTPLLAGQWITYGSPFKTGYGITGDIIPPPEPSEVIGEPAIPPEPPIPEPPACKSVECLPGFNKVFPFGLDRYNITHNFQAIGVNLLGIIFLPCLVGLLLFFWKEKAFPQRVYSVLALGIALYLIAVYGSWGVRDNINPNITTIGLSHVRYWLPIWAFFLPFSAYLYLKITRGNKIAMSIIILGLSIYSGKVVLGSSEDSIHHVLASIRHYQQVQNDFSALAPEDSIIISERSDKIFFPKYRVISVPDKNYVHVFSHIQKLLEQAPIYFYTQMPDSDIQYLQSRHLEFQGLYFKEVKKWEDGFRMHVIRDQQIPLNPPLTRGT